jgi:hypothetical protein
VSEFIITIMEKMAASYSLTLVFHASRVIPPRIDVGKLPGSQSNSSLSIRNVFALKALGAGGVLMHNA